MPDDDSFLVMQAYNLTLRASLAEIVIARIR